MATAVPALADQLGVSQDTVLRAIETGAIQGVRRGPRRFVVSPEERRLVSREWGLIAALRVAFRTEPSVGAAVLFGSHARGEAKSDSDVDLLVHLRRRQTPEQFEALRDRLTERVGKYIDLYADYELGSQPVALLRIVTEGRPIVDRDGFWPRLRRQMPRLRGRAAKAEALLWA